jgi:hypothetical protein
MNSMGYRLSPNNPSSRRSLRCASFARLMGNGKTASDHGNHLIGLLKSEITGSNWRLMPQFLPFNGIIEGQRANIANIGGNCAPTRFA